jgi:hypothetical protein
MMMTPPQGKLRAILLPHNRGLLLDLVVFAANLFLMRLLLKLFFDIIKHATAGEFWAEFAMFLFCLALFVLPPIGATLKRWHFHQRLKGKEAAGEAGMPGGCLFNPIFYFCLTVLIFSTINAFIFQFFYGNREPGEAVFVSSIFIGLALMIVHTYLVYRYFTRPKKAPKSAFLLGPRSELIGDICLFTNMIFFTLVWNLLSFSGLPRPDGVAEVFGRLFILCFLALLLYFPPRMFYLAEDIHRRRTWLTILLANSPLIIRVLIGTSPDSQW